MGSSYVPPESKMTYMCSDGGIKPGDLVQAAPRIGSRIIMRELFDENERPYRMIVVVIKPNPVNKYDRVVVLLNGVLHNFPDEWLVKCSNVHFGQWR